MTLPSWKLKAEARRGNTITKYPIRKVELLKAGTSTLSKLDLWYDADTGRLNKDKRGRYLGKFDGDDQLIAFMRNGSYRITNYDMTNRYEPEKTLLVEKFNPQKPVSAVYVDGDSKQYMVKRFLVETSTVDKEFGFISETIGSRLVAATTSETPEVELEVVKGKDKGKSNEVVNLEDIIDVKGWKALGNRLSQFKVTKVSLVQDEEAGPEEAVTDSDVEASETEKDSQSLKKKKSQPSRIQTSGSKRGTKQASSQSHQSRNSNPNKNQVSQGKKSKQNNKASSGKVRKAKKVKTKKTK